MRLFITHSRTFDLIDSLRRILESQGVQVLVAEQDRRPGEPLAAKVEAAIRASDGMSVRAGTLNATELHRKITMRYAHLCPDDRRLAAAAVSEALASGAVAVAKGTSGGTKGDAASEAREAEAS